MSNLTRKISRNHHSKVHDQSRCVTLPPNRCGTYGKSRNHSKRRAVNTAAKAKRSFFAWLDRYAGQHPSITRSR